MTHTALWKRLDAEGHDACVLEDDAAGWRLHGVAAFRDAGAVVQLAYDLACDREWRSRSGRVTGWCGRHPVHVTASRSAAGAWLVNGAAAPALDGCVDLDLGFTPATNLLQIRRLDLRIGQAADAPAAWLDVTSGEMSVLPQRYERISETTYRYEAPSVGYAGELEVTRVGFVRVYPRLWRLEAGG